MSELNAEAEWAGTLLELARRVHEGEDAIARLAAIEEICDDVIARIPTPDPAVPWDALLAIRKALR